MAADDCPPELRGKVVWALTATGPPGLSARGKWRSLLEQLFNRWAQHPEIILYIDEITRAARLPGGAGRGRADLREKHQGKGDRGSSHRQAQPEGETGVRRGYSGGAERPSQTRDGAQSRLECSLD
jgi:hypothetical protein